MYICVRYDQRNPLIIPAYNVVIVFIQVEDLLTTSTILHSFRRDPRSVIQEGSIYNNRCLLLPKYVDPVYTYMNKEQT